MGNGKALIYLLLGFQLIEPCVVCRSELFAVPDIGFAGIRIEVAEIDFA